MEDSAAEKILMQSLKYAEFDVFDPEEGEISIPVPSGLPKEILYAIAKKCGAEFDYNVGLFGMILADKDARSKISNEIERYTGINVASHDFDRKRISLV
jgi:hypothetical protein